MRRWLLLLQSKKWCHMSTSTCPSLLAAMRGQASQQTLRRNFWQRRRILAVITFWDERVTHGRADAGGLLHGGERASGGSAQA